MGQKTASILLPQLFLDVAARDPDRCAIDIPPSHTRPERLTWTYAELAQRALRVAGGLQASMRQDDIVAILADRGSPWLYVAQLGTLLAGAAYTCLDPKLPDERLRFILDDTHAVRVLHDVASEERLASLHIEPGSVVHIEALASSSTHAVPPHVPWLSEHSLAYVIYTSGSSGTPKGVLLEHGGIAHLVEADRQRFGLDSRDRVVQGSSPSYDSSVEEIWLALSVGATLVVMDEETSRLGPDLVPWLRDEGITVFCPPPTLLRTTQCRDPETELPQLRLLYVGGEALSRDVADTWGRGRWLENGYGPTECTVTVLRRRITPGDAITIGRPIRGHRAWSLNERLEPVPAGEPGELCIAGPGVARGYLNRPQETGARFVHHQQFGRIYRTGDLVRQTPEGDFTYLGRIDTQVKIRGHRVELEEIEAHLAAHPAVSEAACQLQSRGAIEQLVAWVVPEVTASPPSPTALRLFLGDALPAHMLPVSVGFLDRLPRTSGDKLDRRALSELDVVQQPLPEAAQAEGELETWIESVVCIALGVESRIGVEADFFEELGGDSLTAAIAISLLRDDPRTAHLAVRDLYETRSVRALAARATDARPSRSAVSRDSDNQRRHPTLMSMIQAVWLAMSLVAVGPFLWLVACVLLPFLLESLGIIGFLATTPVLTLLLTLLWAPLGLGLAVLWKRALIGRYRAGREPAHGSFHLRNWIVERLVRTVPWSFFHGTVFYNLGLRALGARIGKRVHIHRGVNLLSGGWDLLTIEDDVTLCQDASVRLVDLDDGQFVIGPVTLGRGSTLETRAGVGPDTVLGAGASLAPLSSLPAGARVPEGERWDGIPAQPAGVTEPAPPVTDGHVYSPTLHGVWMILVGTLVEFFYLMPLLVVLGAWSGVTGVTSRDVINWVFEPALSMSLVVPLVAMLTLLVPVGLFLDAILCRLSGAVPTGVIDRWSRAYLKVWLKTGIVDRVGNWLSGTLFWPLWLRLAGMRVGKGCEISTIIDVVPELVEIGDECFFADGIYLGEPRMHQNTVHLARTRFGNNTFLGNHVVVPAGQQLPSDILLGVCTVADDTRVNAGSSWFGHPPFLLPRREVVEMDRRLTHNPGVLRYANRVFWEALRFALPVVPIAAVLGWFAWVGAAAYDKPSVQLLIGVIPGATVVMAMALCAAVLCLKWMLLGRVRPAQHPLWSCWCSRWDFLYVAWGAWARRILSTLEGTLILPCYLRAMGCRIGKHTVLGAGFAQVVDPDMIDIADHATFNGLFQAHSFEDRVLKVDRVQVQSAATVGANAVLLYGCEIGAESRVAPHSVVMKRERLLPGVDHEGSPTW